MSPICLIKYATSQRHADITLIFLNILYHMVVNYQLHAASTIFPGKGPLVPIKEKLNFFL